MRGGDGKKGLFTSDLSAPELLLVQQAGFDPLAQVLGASLYRVGWTNALTNKGGGLYRAADLPTLRASSHVIENRRLTRSLTGARRRAVQRLQLQAQAVKADGVVGARLKIRDWAEGLAEFAILGTAVRRQGVRSRYRHPFTSSLSGQDTARLLSGGYVPLNLVMGASAQQAMMNRTDALWSHREIGSYSRALNQAQSSANRRMAREASELGASGVVGVTFTSKIAEYEAGSSWVLGRIVEWVMVGTAVGSLPASQAAATPKLVMPLRPRRKMDGGSNVP